MYYDYKNIFTIEDLYLLSEGNSSLISNLHNQSLDFTKKSKISSYLIMKKISKRSSEKYKALLERFKALKLQNPIKFTEDSNNISNIGQKSQFLTIQDEIKNEKKKAKKFAFNEDLTQSISDPEPIKIQKNLFKGKEPTKEKAKKPHKKKKRQLEIPNPTPKLKENGQTTDRTDKSSKTPKAVAKRFRPYRIKDPRNRKAMMQDFNDYYNNFSDDDKNEISLLESENNESEAVAAENDEETIENAEEDLENSETSSQEDSASENGSKNGRKNGSKNGRKNGTKNGTKNGSKNGTSSEDEQEEMTNKTPNKNGLSVPPQMRKEVSFQKSEKMSGESTPVKSRSLSRSRTQAHRSTGVVPKEARKNSGEKLKEKNDEVVIKRNINLKVNTVTNPYIEIIEKLLKSQDIFGEDIEGMMGVEERKVDISKEMETNLNLLGEAEKNAYTKILQWNFQIEKLLKKDAKEIKRYQKKMEGMFNSMNEAEKEKEKIEVEEDEESEEEEEEEN